MKRYAFVISKQHLIAHGGIGQFTKSFYEMVKDDAYMDIIMDDEPMKNSLTDYFQNEKVKIITPPDVLSSKTHLNIFSFTDTLNFERMINFRNAFREAISQHLYDGVIINTPEAVPAIYIFNLHEQMPIVFYTHNENCVYLDVPKTNVFNLAFDELTRKFMDLYGLTTGTQTSRNKQAIMSNLPNASVYELPMRVPEQDLLEPVNQERDGLLFIGRWEDRKKPDLFVKACKEAGAKALVMTGAKSISKFQEAFKKEGIECEIRAGIIGKEKTDFIRQAKMAFHPALQECNPFAAMEELHSCPTVAIKEHMWCENFAHLPLLVCEKKDVFDYIKTEYNKPWDQTRYEEQLVVMNQWFDEIKTKWYDFFDSYERKETKNENLINMIKKVDGYSVSKYYQARDRVFVSVEDYVSLANVRKHLTVIQTINNTYISTNENYQPEEDEDEFFKF